ncbi:hypothetical protein BU24DRAFT_483966 [Aaosphaeria arxii CBS 175.79]|uniref:Uncharacterized protein n=1 Tax=Aaosphaeria arxii CBS 175.79 TaxID=1450172 RepID=A0A6A5XMH8_9PLEO|nr:uncharacterized protein BU24DRAFT_483966 [Aaosphaeria arxii CBS 175.79]KAF2014047.1 hypothetical protein BU24DRAFT_483966 [Aaosphaeria arxii CBS 175.79]
MERTREMDPSPPEHHHSDSELSLAFEDDRFSSDEADFECSDPRKDDGSSADHKQLGCNVSAAAVNTAANTDDDNVLLCGSSQEPSKHNTRIHREAPNNIPFRRTPVWRRQFPANDAVAPDTARPHELFYQGVPGIVSRPNNLFESAENANLQFQTGRGDDVPSNVSTGKSDSCPSSSQRIPSRREQALFNLQNLQNLSIMSHTRPPGTQYHFTYAMERVPYLQPDSALLAHGFDESTKGISSKRTDSTQAIGPRAPTRPTGPLGLQPFRGTEVVLNKNPKPRDQWERRLIPDMILPKDWSRFENWNSFVPISKKPEDVFRERMEAIGITVTEPLRTITGRQTNSSDECAIMSDGEDEVHSGDSQPSLTVRTNQMPKEIQRDEVYDWLHGTCKRDETTSSDTDGNDEYEGELHFDSISTSREAPTGNEQLPQNQNDVEETGDEKQKTETMVRVTEVDSAPRATDD